MTEKKSLDKMTVKELREIAAGISGITGVHAMKKAELLEAIMKNEGAEEVPKPIPKASKGKHPELKTVADLKKKIAEMVKKKEEAIAQKDKKLIKIYRRRINRLKKRTRKLAQSE